MVLRPCTFCAHTGPGNLPTGFGGLRRTRRLTLACTLLLAFLAVQPAVAAEKTGKLPVFQDNFGGTGLFEIPNARPEKVGQFTFGVNHVDPYTNLTFSFQPFSWLQAGFRYTSISNRAYKASDTGRHYLDKGFNLKLFLLNESRYMPQVALGFRDLAGTGLFSSEYLVANKRWNNFDFTLGLAWGYLGSKHNLPNPLSLFSGHFDDRQTGDNSNGGELNIKSWFTGRPSLFAGIQYTTPWRPLTLQLEYEGHDSSKEPLNNDFRRDFPLNFGARLKINKHISLTAAYERGNTLMLGTTIGLNFADISQTKTNPPPVAVEPGNNNHPKNSWQSVADRLHSNAGIAATRISKQGDMLVVDGRPTTFRHLARSELRGNRILHNAAGSRITQFKYRWQGEGGFFLRDDVLPRAPLPRQPFITSPASPLTDLDYRRGVVSSGLGANAAHEKKGETLYRQPSSRRFGYSIGPGLNYNYGGPDGFLYQGLLQASGTWYTDPHGWFSGTLAYSLFDNLKEDNYIGPSKLPRVRSDAVRYIDQTDLGLYNLQYTRTMRLSDNLFGMAYAGLLEQMYGGVGGEILYRPFNSRLAFGADINWVKKRDYDTGFGFQDYSTVTGLATAYIDTGIAGVLARLSVGRYLAKDYGGTIDLSRTFKSGITLGAYAVLTSAGDDYGEGSFNKGIYVSIPLDIFFVKSSRDYVGINYSPLTRDGGASLNRRYTLYGLTNDRALHHYWRGFKRRN